MCFTVNGRSGDGIAADAFVSMLDGDHHRVSQQTQVVHHLFFKTHQFRLDSSPLSFLTFYFRPQATDVDATYRVSGVTGDSVGTDGCLWDSEDLLLATDTPPPCLGHFYPSSIAASQLLSPVDEALTRLNRPASSEWTDQRDSPPMETCDLRYSGFLRCGLRTSALGS